MSWTRIPNHQTHNRVESSKRMNLRHPKPRNVDLGSNVTRCHVKLKTKTIFWLKKQQRKVSQRRLKLMQERSKEVKSEKEIELFRKFTAIQSQNLMKTIAICQEHAHSRTMGCPPTIRSLSLKMRPIVLMLSVVRKKSCHKVKSVIRSLQPPMQG